MRREEIVVLWFTGLISQYNISSYDILNLKINHNLLNKIFNTYKASRYVALINVRNDLEKNQYMSLIQKEGLADKLLFVFININDSYQGVLGTLRYTYDIKYYIDCSRKRLASILGLIEPQKLIHISQLLD